MNDNLTKLLNKLIKDAANIPRFINVNNYDDLDLANTISSLLLLIKDLIKPYLIPHNDIFILYLDYLIIEYVILTNDLPKVTKYINRLLNNYLLYTEKTEEYECAANIRFFMQLKQYEKPNN